MAGGSEAQKEEHKNKLVPFLVINSNFVWGTGVVVVDNVGGEGVCRVKSLAPIINFLN